MRPVQSNNIYFHDPGPNRPYWLTRLRRWLGIDPTYPKEHRHD